jgi:hypothetical protein
MSDIKGNTVVTPGMLTTKKSTNGDYLYACSVDYANITTYITYEGDWDMISPPSPYLPWTKVTVSDGTRFGFCFKDLTSTYSGECTINSSEYGPQMLTISFPWSPSGS